MLSVSIQVATKKHASYAQEICELIEASAKQRGTGIAKRSPEYIIDKINEGKAILALTPTEELAGFCYIESWGAKKYVANSGLVVAEKFRGTGLGKNIKKKAFDHSRKVFPNAKLFGLTTSLPVMKINSDLGYSPVTYNQLTTDETFWSGCQSCVNYKILSEKSKQNCLCTAMMYDPNKKNPKWNFIKRSKIYERFMKLKKSKMTLKFYML